jgi:hypothetical protein
MFISSATCCKGNHRYHERGCRLSDKSDCLHVDTVFDCLFWLSTLTGRRPFQAAKLPTGANTNIQNTALTFRCRLGCKRNCKIKSDGAKLLS